jgi:hypothetical protein
MGDEFCTYCQQPGVLVEVKGMKGLYHLKCVVDAKKAWEAVRPKSFLDRFVK